MAMRHIQDHSKDSPMDGEQGVNKSSGQEHIASGNAITRYRRLPHRHCASLDLETAFKQIKISRDIQPDLCQECRTEKCKCPAFTPGMPCSSASSTPTNINSDHEEIPELVENMLPQVHYPPVQSPSDEEADQEVTAICSAPVYYRVRSHITHRRRYYMYNALDTIEEMSRQKPEAWKCSTCTGTTCRTLKHAQKCPVTKAETFSNLKMFK